MSHSSRTQKRIDLLARLLAEFAKRDLSITEAAEIVQYTRSGARNFIRELRLAGLVQIGGEYAGGSSPPATYHLIGTPAQVQAYVDTISGAAPRAPKPPSTLLERCLADPTRHLHVLRDDTYIKPVMHCFTPFRDGLVAALFGPAQGAHA